MLGAEQRNQFDAGGVIQAFNGRAAFRIEPRVICDQPDVLAPQRRKFLRLQYIDSCLHASDAVRVFFTVACAETMGTRKKQSVIASLLQRPPRDFGKAFPPLCVTNDILERFVRRFVVSVKCVCYIQAQDPDESRETHN